MTSTFFPSIALSFALGMTGAGAARAAPPIEIAFIGEEGPPLRLFIESTSTTLKASTARQLRYAIVSMHGEKSRAIEDTTAMSTLMPAALPSLPRGTSLSEATGGIIVTIDDAGAWQEELVPARPPEAPDAKPAKCCKRQPEKANAEVPVVSARALRLQLAPIPVDAGASAVVDATLYGTKVRVRGRALVTRALPAGTRAVLAAERGALVAAPPGFVVDTRVQCGRVMPTAFQVVFDPGAVVGRVMSGEAIGCLPAGVAVGALEGTRVDAKGDAPLAGMLIVREGAPPSAP